jgi:hypothetical protein
MPITLPRSTTTPSTTSERAPMKQSSSMMVGRPAAAPARRRCRRRRRGAARCRSARSCRPWPRCRPSCRRRQGADVDEARHQHHVAADVGAAAHDRARHHARAELADAASPAPAKRSRHLVPERRRLASTSCISLMRKYSSTAFFSHSLTCQPPTTGSATRRRPTRGRPSHAFDAGACCRRSPRRRSARRGARRRSSMTGAAAWAGFVHRRMCRWVEGRAPRPGRRAAPPAGPRRRGVVVLVADRGRNPRRARRRWRCGHRARAGPARAAPPTAGQQAGAIGADQAHLGASGASCANSTGSAPEWRKLARHRAAHAGCERPSRPASRGSPRQGRRHRGARRSGEMNSCRRRAPGRCRGCCRGRGDDARLDHVQAQPVERGAARRTGRRGRASRRTPQRARRWCGAHQHQRLAGAGIGDARVCQAICSGR